MRTDLRSLVSLWLIKLTVSITIDAHTFMYMYHLSIIVDPRVTELNFTFAKKHKMPFYYVSASDGTNVVKVST